MGDSDTIQRPSHRHGRTSGRVFGIAHLPDAWRVGGQGGKKKGKKIIPG